jgi:predicted house-cleaning noncanonical NTP pyrophosphatase (MazG superfamily)
MPPPGEDESAPASISPQSARVEIRSAPDLDRFAEEHSDATKIVLRVLPLKEFIRDSAFVDQIAEVAVATGAAVELVGSSLAHPYYVLRRAGVTVVCLDAFDEPAMIPNKLVRDGIVEHIVAGGEAATSYMATGSDLTSRLRRKAVEEAIELLRANDPEETIEEMADLVEVLDALRAAVGYTRESLRAAQKVKRVKRGGFRAGAVLIRTGGSTTRTRGASNGTVPLFDDEPSWETPWQVRQSGNRIRLQCVPPLESEPHTFRLESEGVQLYVEYVGGVVEITVATAPTAAEASATLF